MVGISCALAGGLLLFGLSNSQPDGPRDGPLPDGPRVGPLPDGPRDCLLLEKRLFDPHSGQLKAELPFDSDSAPHTGQTFLGMEKRYSNHNVIQTPDGIDWGWVQTRRPDSNKYPSRSRDLRTVVVGGGVQ